MSKGTAHHKAHGLAGWGLIISLPFAIFSAVKAIPGGSQGFIDWLSTPVGGIGFFAFVLAAVTYCRLEFDEVVMDYFDGGLRSFGLIANRLVAFAVKLIVAYVVIKLAFLG